MGLLLSSARFFSLRVLAATLKSWRRCGQQRDLVFGLLAETYQGEALCFVDVLRQLCLKSKWVLSSCKSHPPFPTVPLQPSLQDRTSCPGVPVSGRSPARQEAAPSVSPLGAVPATEEHCSLTSPLAASLATTLNPASFGSSGDYRQRLPFVLAMRAGRSECGTGDSF